MSLANVLLPAPTSGEPAAAVTADLAMHWACTPALWRAQVRHVPGDRWYLNLFDHEQASAWLITWAPGTSLAFHDHGEAAGSVAVVQGTLTERFTERRHGLRPASLRQRSLRAGSVTSFGPDHIHEVRNNGAVPVVSIHVYTPQLEQMRFYAGALAAIDTPDGGGLPVAAGPRQSPSPTDGSPAAGSPSPRSPSPGSPAPRSPAPRSPAPRSAEDERDHARLTRVVATMGPMLQGLR